ncbi:MAG: hypothetical protein KFH87_07740 [Bacteroidetes bacterium]|nr:hypothetical protein [Bacteroidota bacterium]
MNITSGRMAGSLEIVLLLCFVVAMYFQQNTGLADNGDYTRSMLWMTPGPTGMEANWPDPDSEDWSKRFFNYWIPYWDLDMQLPKSRTSAAVLWLPGVLLSSVFFSGSVLYLPSVSLFPKLILVTILLLLFTWGRQHERHRLLLLGGIAFPFILLTTSTDYVAYFNSFYQEASSLIFLLLLLVSILILKQRPSFPTFLFSIVCVFLLATSKASNVYWPALAVPIIVHLRYRDTLTNMRLAALAVALLAMLTFASMHVTGAGASKENPYHSLFYGALMFSEQPGEHLRRLNMPDADTCIHASAFTQEGMACIARHENKLSYLTTLSVLYREPLVFPRMMTYVFDNMQDISLVYLGKYAIDDPRSKTTPRVGDGYEQRFWLAGDNALMLNLWSTLKYRVFPTGYALLLLLILFIAVFIHARRYADVRKDLALVGLLCSVACVVDMSIAILGDGRYELMKHLFLANVLFDIALIVFLVVVSVHVKERIGEKGWKTRKQLPSVP